MNISITLDYELFLNDNTGSVTKCLIEPMNHIMKICKKHNIKLTVFVDAAYLWKLFSLKSEYKKLEEDYNSVRCQIIAMHNEGHEIALHIHPQWYYSIFDGDKWCLDFEHYKLSDMDPKSRSELFACSKNHLEEIIDASISGFRAGGYSIQTCDNFEELMNQNGLMYDSSVLRGAQCKSNLHFYDYKKIPFKSAYRFENSVVNEDSGQFWEYPIDTVSLNLVYFLLFKKYSLKRYAKDNINFGDGGNNSVSLLNRIRMGIKKVGYKKTISANVDYQSFFFLESAFRNKIKSKCCEHFTIIGHPKNFSQASLDYLERFIEKNSKNNKFLSLSQFLKTNNEQ